MTIKEAIVYCYEVSNDICACDECRKDHLQLAHWLEELLDYRKLYEFQDSFGERYLTPEMSFYSERINSAYDCLEVVR